jgi:hypothetical protein
MLPPARKCNLLHNASTVQKIFSTVGQTKKWRTATAAVRR